MPRKTEQPRPAGRGVSAVRFLALSPVVAYALLAGVALVILLLHLFKPPPRRLVIPSVLLWARIGRGRKRPPARRLLSLLLALGAGLSLALALTRPEIAAIGASGQPLALVLDNSPSMAALMSDGRTRWEHAIEQARALLAAVERGDRSDAAGHRRAASACRASSNAMPRSQRSSACRPPRGDRRACRGRRSSPARKCTCSPMASRRSTAPEGAVVHSVFEAADNVAVTAFEARPLAQDPTRYEAMVQVLNASPGDRRVRLLITGGGGFSITQDLDLRAGETVNATFDVSDFEGGVLGAAAVCETDAFALDDLAYAVIPPHRPKRVLLVTAGNPPLEDALRHVPGMRLSVVTPAALHGSGQARRSWCWTGSRRPSRRRPARSCWPRLRAPGWPGRPPCSPARASPTGTRTMRSRAGSRGAT